jgi:hypothetical protein
VDETARRQVARRLESLLARWGGPGDGRPAPAGDLETASAEDIFDLIADEFGKA